MDNAENVCKEFDKLYNKAIQKEDFFKFKKKILLNYLSIQEQIPFEQYFKNLIVRLIKEDSLKKHLFLKKEKVDLNLIESIIEKILIEEELKLKNQKKNDDSIDNNNTNNLNDTDNTKIKDSNDKKMEKNDSQNFSLLSIDMKAIKQKFEENQEDIEEIISQKEYLLNQIINENNESNKNRLTYFVDTNNLSGNKFEKAGIKYIFELLNCLSIKQDFNFYYDIVIKEDKFKKIFKNLDEVKGIQLDFVINDLRIIDLINMLIYLYPNIIDLNNLKEKPFEKGMDFNKLKILRAKYKRSQKRIDIFGEIGKNIFNEDEKIDQVVKYTNLYNNIKQLKKNDDKEIDSLLEQLKIKKNNEKLILFLTNGEYSKIYNKNLSHEKLIKIQNESNINSLIIYLKDDYNSKERNVIDNLLLNFNLDNGKNKFIKQLIDLKQKKIKQYLINDMFQNISFKLNIIENKIKTIEKDYSEYIKEKKEKLMMNEFTSLFLKKENEINKYMNSGFEQIFKLKLNENISFDHEINIILLHPKNKIINSDIIKMLVTKRSNKIRKISFYDLDYEYNSKKFYSFDEIKDDLTKKSKKKIYIIICLYEKIEDLFFFGLLSKNLINNYLSYLYLITKKEISFDSEHFLDNHIKTFIYHKGIENDIKKDIENRFEEIQDNYKNYLIINRKYIKILDEYNKQYQYTLIISENIIIKKEKMKFKELINEHKQLLIEKIAQDISFIISLSIVNKNKIKELIKEDLESIIKDTNDNVIQLFLNTQTIIEELSNIINDFMKNLAENDQNSIYKNLSEEEKNYKYDEEIFSEDGIQKIYKDDDSDENESNEIIEDGSKNVNKDKVEGIFNNFGVVDNKINNNQNITEDQISTENTFKIDFLIQEIEDKLKYSIILINLKLYYKFFSTVISKIFINNVSKLLSEEVLKGKK